MCSYDEIKYIQKHSDETHRQTPSMVINTLGISITLYLTTADCMHTHTHIHEERVRMADKAGERPLHPTSYCQVINWFMGWIPVILCSDSHIN